MVYHEVRRRNGKSYNYIVHNERLNNKWIKKSKFIGTGSISKERIQEEIKKFKIELKTKKKYEYLTEEDVERIELIRKEYNEYLKKAGKSGVQKFNEWFSTEFTYNTNAIEGSTLNLRETSLILNEKITPKGASLREVWEAKNHKQAFDFMKQYKGDLNEQFILKLNAHILRNIDDYNAGKYREVNVYITGTKLKLPEPEEVPSLMKELIKWYKKNKKKYHPLELSALVSMKFVTIHPFVDGNGRVSRLIMNFILKKNNYPQINIYFREREEYIKCVRKANDEKYEQIIKFIIKTLIKNSKIFIQ